MRCISLGNAQSSEQTGGNQWEIFSYLEQQKGDPESKRFKKELSVLWKWKEELHKLQCIDAKKEIDPFLDFFVAAISNEYYHYTSSKKKAWSIVRNILCFLCITFFPAFTTVALSLITFILGFISGEQQEMPSVVCVLGGIAAFLAVILAGVYPKWLSLKSDRETWVRHSASYHRLRLAMNQFLISPRGQEDFCQLKRQTFAIMEQNLDQFVLNLSGKGMASRRNVTETKENSNGR